MKTIVVVTDDLSFLNLSVVFLELGGFSVISFSDPKRAFAFLSKEKEALHLLIADFEMSGISGAELVSLVKKTRPKMRTICLTRESNAEQVCRQAGCDAFLAKPVSFKLLQKEVERVLS